MKKVNFLVGCFMVAALSTTFVGCSSDDVNYLPPTLSITTTTGEIDLSDELIFHIPVNIESEAGLKSLVVTDNENNEWLNQTTFTNPNKVDKISIDLSECPETKILLLNIKATALDGKITETIAPFSLNVYVPVLFASMEKVLTISDKADLDITIGRGVKGLDKLKVYVNDAAASEVSLSANSMDKKITKTLSLTDLKDGKNSVKVEIFEEGATAPALTEICDVARINLEKVSESIRINQGEGGYKCQFRRNSNGTISFVKFTPPVIYDEMTYEPKSDMIQRFLWFTYNDNGFVIKIEDKEDRTDCKTYEYSEKILNTYEFTYNSSNELEKVTRNSADYVNDVVYANGDLASYKIDGKEYTPKYATVANNTVRVDCLDEKMTGNSFKFDGTESINPYYVAGLPAVIPGYIEEMPLQIMYSQYLFNSMNTGWNTGWTQTTNSDGDLNYKTSYTLNNKEWNLSFSIYK